MRVYIIYWSPDFHVYDDVYSYASTVAYTVAKPYYTVISGSLGTKNDFIQSNIDLAAAPGPAI